MEALQFDSEYYELASGDLRNDPEFGKQAEKWGYKFS